MMDMTLTEMKKALLDRPPFPFKGSELERDTLERVISRSIYILGRHGKAAALTYFNSEEYQDATWARARYFAYQLVKTGLTYTELCQFSASGNTCLPEYIVIEHAQIAIWEKEAQELLARKAKAARAIQK